MRLYENRLIEYFADEDDLSDSDEEKERNRGRSNAGKRDPGLGSSPANEEIEGDDNNFSKTMFDSTFKNRKALNDVLSNEKTPQTINRLNFVGHVLTLLLFALAIVEYFVTSKQFKEINQNISLINLSFNRIAEVMNISSKTNDLRLLQLGFLVGGQASATDADKAFKASITTSIEQIEVIQKKLLIDLTGVSISEEHRKLISENEIEMWHLEGDKRKFDLNEATKQVVAKSFNLKETILAQIQPPNSDLYFINYNTFNAYYQGILKSSGFYVKELDDRTNSKLSVFLIFIIIAGVLVILGVLIMIPCLWRVNKQKEEILGLFFDIPEDNVKYLYSKCEKFISNLQVGEDEDEMSEMDDVSVNKNQAKEEDGAESVLRKRRKKFKTNCKANKWFIFLIVVFGVGVMGYFGQNYWKNSVLLSNFNSMVKEVNATSSAESFFYFAYNTQKQLFIDKAQTILLESPLEVARKNINNMFQLDSMIHQVFSSIDFLGTLYKCGNSHG